VKISTGEAYLASPLMNAAELIVLDFQREHDVVVKAEPDVRGAPSRVKVANYFNVRVAHDFAMCPRELVRKHLHSTHNIRQ